MRRRVMLGVVVALVAGGGAVGGLPASASPVCASAAVGGSVTGPRQLGPVCAPYSYPVMCRSAGTGFSPYVEVYTSACVPAP